MKKFKINIILLLAILMSFASFGQDTGANPYVGIGHQAVCWNGDSTIYQYHLVQIGKLSNMPKYTRYISADGQRITPATGSISSEPCVNGNDSTVIDFTPIENKLDSILLKLCDTLEVNANIDFSELINQIDSVLQVRNQDTLKVELTNLDSLQKVFQNALDSALIDVNLDYDSLFNSFLSALDSAQVDVNINTDSLKSAFLMSLDSAIVDVRLDYDSIQQAFQAALDSANIDVTLDYDSLTNSFQSALDSAVVDVNINTDSLQSAFQNALDSTIITVQLDSTSRINYDSMKASFLMALDSAEIDVNINTDSLKDAFAMALDSIIVDVNIDKDSLQSAFQNALDSTIITVQLDSTSRINYDSMKASFLMALDSTDLDVNVNLDSLKSAFLMALDSAKIDVNVDSLENLLVEIRDILNMPCDTVIVNTGLDSIMLDISSKLDSLNFSIDYDSIRAIIDSTQQIAIPLELCDIDTITNYYKPIIRILTVKNGVTTITDKDYNGVDYTTVGVVAAGKCNPPVICTRSYLDSIAYATLTTLQDSVLKVEIVGGQLGINYDSIRLAFQSALDSASLKIDSINLDSLKFNLDSLETGHFIEMCDYISATETYIPFLRIFKRKGGAVTFEDRDYTAQPYTFQGIPSIGACSPMSCVTDTTGTKSDSLLQEILMALSGGCDTVPVSINFDSIQYAFEAALNNSNIINYDSMKTAFLMALDSATIDVNVDSLEFKLDEVIAALKDTIEVKFDYNQLADSIAAKFDLDSIRVITDSSFTMIPLELCDYDTANQIFMPFIRVYTFKEGSTTFQDKDYNGVNYTPNGIIASGTCVAPADCDTTVNTILRDILLELQNGTGGTTIDYTLLAQEIGEANDSNFVRIDIDSLSKAIATQIKNNETPCAVTNTFKNGEVLSATSGITLAANTYNYISITVKEEPVSISLDGATPISYEKGFTLTLPANECQLGQSSATINVTGTGRAVYSTKQ